VWLTDQGKALLDKHLPQLVEEKEKFFKGLDRTDLTRLIDYLKIIQRNMEREFR
jgi:hypothetical protein